MEKKVPFSDGIFCSCRISSRNPIFQPFLLFSRGLRGFQKSMIGENRHEERDMIKKWGRASEKRERLPTFRKFRGKNRILPQFSSLYSGRGLLIFTAYSKSQLNKINATVINYH